ARRGFNTLESQAIEFERLLARQTSISLGAFFSERQNELSILTNVSGIESLEPAEQRNIMLTLLSEQPAYYELTLIDASGVELERITRGEIITRDDLTNRSGDPLFQQAIENRSINYSDVYFNEDARDRLITIAVPIEDLYTGDIGHILVAEIR